MVFYGKSQEGGGSPGPGGRARGREGCLRGIWGRGMLNIHSRGRNSHQGNPKGPNGIAIQGGVLKAVPFPQGSGAMKVLPCELGVYCSTLSFEKYPPHHEHCSMPNVT